MLTIKEKTKLSESLTPINKLNIIVDVDGCLCLYDFKFLVKKHFGVDLSPLAIYAYDLADVLGVAPIMINKMFKEQVYGEPNFINGAIDTLTYWKEIGHRIYIYSNRVKYMGEFGLIDWLNKYNIPYDDLYYGIRKDYYYHIDDSPAKLMDINARNKLLFTQPWNKHCLNITNSLYRVNDWNEVREYSRRYENEIGGICRTESIL